MFDFDEKARSVLENGEVETHMNVKARIIENKSARARDMEIMFNEELENEGGESEEDYEDDEDSSNSDKKNTKHYMTKSGDEMFMDPTVGIS